MAQSMQFPGQPASGSPRRTAACGSLTAARGGMKARLSRAVPLMCVNHFEEGCREYEALLAERHAGSLGGQIEFLAAWMCWARFKPEGVAAQVRAARDHLEAAHNPADREMRFFHAMFYGLPGMRAPMTCIERVLSRLSAADPWASRPWVWPALVAAA